jgi:hypothetical protein
MDGKRASINRDAGPSIGRENQWIISTLNSKHYDTMANPADVVVRVGQYF